MVLETDRQVFQLICDEIKNVLDHKRNYSQKHLIPETISKRAKKALQDLEDNHDTAWSVEVFRNSLNQPDRTYLIYRGRKIKGTEFWAEVYRFAKSLKALGIKKGDIVPVMIANSPEFIYTFTALNLIGAVMNIVGPWFDKDYLKELLDESKCEYVFFSDDINERLVYAAEQSTGVKNVVLFSLTDSLPRNKNGEIAYEGKEYDDKFNHFENRVPYFKETLSKRVIDNQEFRHFGENYTDTVVADMTLDSPNSITYTSGTTKPGRPKGCMHSNRNNIALARFKKSDVTGLPTVKQMLVLAHLPSYTETVLTACYTDPLWMGWTVALEPYFELEFYPYTVLMNKPSYTCETPEYEKYVYKKLDTEWKTVKMPYRLVVCVAGQSLSPGLERYMNRISAEHSFGTDVLPWPVTPAKVSIGGGSTENGGIFTTLFKGLRELSPKYFLRGKKLNLLQLGLAELSVIDRDGRHLPPYQRGLLVVNSPTNQIGYVDPEHEKKMRIVDINGKEWYNGGTSAYMDEFGGIRMLDRQNTDILLANGTYFPRWKICDYVQEDVKNIMEAFLVVVEDAGQEKYIFHIEMQPDAKKNQTEILKGVKTRLSGRIPEEVLERMYFRFRSFEEGFPVAGTGKTDLHALIAEGVSDSCISYLQI